MQLASKLAKGSGKRTDQVSQAGFSFSSKEKGEFYSTKEGRLKFLQGIALFASKHGNFRVIHCRMVVL